jgi:hypothetical protein
MYPQVCQMILVEGTSWVLNHGLTIEYKFPKHVPYLLEQESEKKVQELHEGIMIKLFKSSNHTIVQTKQELG